MSELHKSWRKFVAESRVKPKRVVGNKLIEVTIEQLRDFPLDEQELSRIKKWGELDGDPSFLGSGTMGSAYQFASKVLKITRDTNEARAASLIAGKFHPNVYRVHKVGKRYDDIPENVGMPKHNFLIVYDLVAEEVGGPDLPNQEQQIVIKNMFANLKDIYYNWPDNFNDIKQVFLMWSQKNQDVLNSLNISKFEKYDKKLSDLISSAGIEGQSKEALLTAWGSTAGFYGPGNLTPEGVERAIKSPLMTYINEVSSGLTFLKQNGVRFVDLKTTNVMNDDGRLVIIDVGKSNTEGVGDITTVS